MLADWLFFRHGPGISFPLFVLALGAALLLTNDIAASRRDVLIHAGILLLAIFPSLEEVNVMSAAIATLGIGSFAVAVVAVARGDLKERFTAVGYFLMTGPIQFLEDLTRLLEWTRRRGGPTGPNVIKRWLVPLALGAVFLALFAAANPLIEAWLAQWDVAATLKQLDIHRLAFWTAAGIVVWRFIRASSLPVRDLGTSIASAAEAALSSPTPSAAPLRERSTTLLNDAAVMRSLVVFNLLFAVQTILDINYLWRGAVLPDGMSYASYAHRGAYPLIVTALLAAAFVMVAMRPGSAAERSPAMRMLVFFWVGQNVLLVMSSILRLDLYIATYLLTYWRIAALIWMLVVAAGLVLIVVRIVTYRSNAWLISANVGVLVLTMYVCSFVNFTNFIASYNVSHGRDIVPGVQPVDLSYLFTLGPQAIPAIDRYLAGYSDSKPPHLVNRRNQLAAAHWQNSADWRTWTFRRWRLSRYLLRSSSASP
jgi:hypothetical protein